MERKMPPTLRASAVFVAAVVAIALAPPVIADPMDPIPGNGVFVSARYCARALPNGRFRVDVRGVDKQRADSGLDVRVVYLQHADANKDHVIQTNMSVGPMFANVNTTVKAFESQNCQPWTRVP